MGSGARHARTTRRRTTHGCTREREVGGMHVMRGELVGLAGPWPKGAMVRPHRPSSGIGGATGQGQAGSGEGM